MTRGNFLVCLSACFGVSSVACTESLGPCDEAVAQEVVFEAGGPRGGIPAFAGQGLLTASCGNQNYCHASTIVDPTLRFGVPEGFTLDVSVPCDERADCDEERIERLRRNQLRVLRRRHDIVRRVASGDMPPGARGAALEHPFGYRTGPPATAPLLPHVASPEGRAILKNWLACGAPVVESTTAPTVDSPPGVSCGRGLGGVGECIVKTDLVLPEPNWPSIFEGVIEPECGRTCHGPSNVDQREESALDLSEMELAYDALVNASAEGVDCGDGSGRVRIVPREPEASLLIHKLRGFEGLDPEERCGDPMPQADSLYGEDVVRVIEQWIADGACAGAHNDTECP